MTTKRKIQTAVDFAMTVLLPILMAYTLIGEDVHEWAGLAMFLLFLFHHGLNWKWHKNLLRGRYTTVRVLGTVVNGLIFLLMLTLMLSGISMSRHAFSSLSFDIGASLARTAHLAASYWGYVLTSVHLGLHGNMLMGMAKRMFHAEKPSWIRTVFLRIIAGILAFYGIYAFVKRGFGSYMLLHTKFVFFDFTERRIFFILDYLAIMALFAILGYYTAKLVPKFTGKNIREEISLKASK